MMIIVVCSVDNDETSLCNKAFLATEHKRAWEYFQEVEENTGGHFRMLLMEVE